MASRKDIVSACDRYLAAVSAGDVDGVTAAFSRCGLRERERRDSGDWLALLLERSD